MAQTTIFRPSGKSVSGGKLTRVMRGGTCIGTINETSVGVMAHTSRERPAHFVVCDSLDEAKSLFRRGTKRIASLRRTTKRSKAKRSKSKSRKAARARLRKRISRRRRMMSLPKVPATLHAQNLSLLAKADHNLSEAQNSLGRITSMDAKVETPRDYALANTVFDGVETLRRRIYNRR